MKNRLVAPIFLLALGLACGASPESDWPQWMGPGRDGAAAASGVFPDEGEVELSVAWRRPLPGGYSSLTVAGGRVVTLASDPAHEFLVALDAADGRELWRLVLDDAGVEKASSTPAVGAGRVFAISSRGRMVAVAAPTGAEIWSRDLAASLGAVPPSYGMSTSPLLVDGRVVVLVGGGEAHNLVAFDQASGEIAWSSHHASRSSYASPALWTVGNRRQIVTPADDRLYAVRPEDGSLLWRHDGLGYLDRIPLRLPGDRIFLAQETRAVMLRLRSDGLAADASRSGWEVRELWRTRDLKDSYSPVVFHADSLFGFDGTFLVALDAGTGEPRWRQQVGQGSLILVDGHLLILDALTGEVRLVRADGAGFVERARMQVFPEGGSYAPPSFAGGRIFVRGARQIAALGATPRISPPRSPTPPPGP